MEENKELEACKQAIPDGFELVETEKLQKLIQVNQTLSKQNNEHKQDMATVIASFAGLQVSLGIGSKGFSPSMLMKLTNPKTLEKLKAQLTPMMEIVAKYMPEPETV